MHSFSTVLDITYYFRICKRFSEKLKGRFPLIYPGVQINKSSYLETGPVADDSMVQEYQRFQSGFSLSPHPIGSQLQCRHPHGNIELHDCITEASHSDVYKCRQCHFLTDAGCKMQAMIEKESSFVANNKCYKLKVVSAAKFWLKKINKNDTLTKIVSLDLICFKKTLIYCPKQYKMFNCKNGCRLYDKIPV